MLNYVSFDINRFLRKDSLLDHNQFDYFDNLEILQGKCLCEFILDREPAKVMTELKKSRDRVKSYGNPE